MTLEPRTPMIKQTPVFQSLYESQRLAHELLLSTFQSQPASVE